MPSSFPAAASCRVNATSFSLGAASPDGWLCAMITEAALSVSGPANTSRGWASEVFRVSIDLFSGSGALVQEE
jgi:hypothetical protein